jgi:hypothetical protein
MKGERTLKKQAIETAKALREQLGGTIFAFPIEPDNPFSTYAVVVYGGGEYFVYPEATDVSEAATGVLTILEEFKKAGLAKSYEEDVRMIIYQPQLDAPSVVMRRLKRGY